MLAAAGVALPLMPLMHPTHRYGGKGNLRTTGLENDLD